MEDFDYASLMKDHPAPAVMPNVSSPPADTAADDANPYLDMMQGYKSANLQAARGATLINSDANPDHAARAQELSSQLGIPAAVIESDLPTYESRAKAIHNNAVLADNPMLSSWLASNKEAARAAQDDFDKLGTLDKIVQALVSGGVSAQHQNELGRLYNVKQAAALTGTSVPETDSKISALESYLNEQPLTGGYGALQTVSGFGFGMLDNYVHAQVYGLVGGVAGAAIGAPVAGVGAGPGAAGGYVAGTAFGFKADMSRVAAGLNYRDTQFIRDRQGQPLSETSRQVGALLTGLLTYKIAGIGMGQTGEVAGDALAKLNSDAVTAALQRPTVAAAMTRLTTSMGKGAASGAALNASMEAANVLGEEMTKQLSPGDFDTVFNDPKTRDLALSRLTEAAATGAILFGAIHGLAGSVGLYGDIIRARQARLDVQMMTALQNGTADSALHGRSRQAFADFMHHQMDGTPVENLYLPVDKVLELYQGAKIDPNVMRSQDPLFGWVKDMPEQINQARQHGGDIVMPTVDYVTHLAGTDVGNSLLPDMRVRPDSMSLNEAKKFSENYRKSLEITAQDVAGETQKTGIEHIYEDVIKQATEAGFSASQSRQYAALYAARYGTRAERLGIDPLEAYQRSHVTIQAGDVSRGTKGEKAFAQDINPVGRRGVSLQRAVSERLPEEAKAQEMRTVIGKMLGREEFKKHADELQGLDRWLGEQKGSLSNREVMDFMRGPELMQSESKKMHAKEIILSSTEKLSMDEQGRWTLVDTELGLNERILESEAIDVLVRRAAKNTALKPLISQHFPMHGFHDQEGKRGSITFGGGETIINLFKGHDLSTLLHETGHLWLEELKADAALPEAPEQLREDLATVLKWMGADKPESIKTEHHEQFARAVETYFMEGKAPSKELALVFQRFRTWLTNIYRTLRGLDTPIDDGIRSVFDRMLASDSEIEQAQRATGILADQAQQKFRDKLSGLMTKAEFSAYIKAIERANTEAHETLLPKVMASVKRARSADFVSERERALKEATTEVDARPEIQVLQSGMKIDRAEIEKRDPGMAYFLPPDMLAKEGGTHPDVLAEKYGFGSGEEMLKALTQLEQDKRNADASSGKTRSIRDQLIHEAAAAKMTEKYGDLMNEESIHAEAMAAIHNRSQEQALATELRVMGRKASADNVPLDLAREWAQRTIANKAVGEVQSTGSYARNEARFAKAAEAALLAGKPQEAYLNKRQQLLNHLLYTEAKQAQEDIEKGLTYQRKFDREASREKLDGGYLEQIDALRDRFDFRKNPTPSPGRQSLEKWADSQRASGYEPQISDWLAQMENGVPYRRLSVEKFRSVMDAMHSIEYLAREQHRITIEGQARDLDAVVAELIKPMQERGEKFPQEKIVEPPQSGVDSAFAVARYKLGVALRSSIAALKPQEFKRNKYDMHEIAGPFGEYIFERLYDRNYWKQDQLKSISKDFQAMGESLGKEWQKSLYDLVDNKTLTDPSLSTPDNPVLMKITRSKLLGIARNVGNESNFAKLTKGMGWDAADVWQFLHENMTEKDWRATQATWDVFEKYWPETEQMIKRLGGVMPDKIPLRPFETKFGQMRGGYSPINYDPLRSKLTNRLGDFDVAAGEKLTDQNTYYKSTTTFNGSLMNRKEGYSDIMDLDYHGIEARLRDTIHDLAYREALIDVQKILKHKDFREQFIASFGREEYSGMVAWLEGVKGMQSSQDNLRGLEKALQYARTGVVMTGIAYRISTVLVHGGSAGLKSLGYLGNKDGAGYFASRVARMATGNAIEDIRAAQEKFPEIRSRMMQMDRDYKEGSASMFHGEDWRAKNDRYGHAFVAWSDMLSAVPTAWAAYDLAITKGVPENMGGTGKPMTEAQAVRYANKIVREAHGTALEVNRSVFMQQRGVAGLFGTIYGFMNNTFGQMADMLDKAVVGGNFKNKPALIARAMATLIIPALWAQYIKQGGPKQDESTAAWTGKAITGEVAGTIPFLRDAWSMVEYHHGSEVAPIRIIDDIVKTGQDLHKEWNDHDSKIIQDSANSIGELFHIGGLGQAGKTLQYFRELKQGKKRPADTGELLHDAALGHKH